MSTIVEAPKQESPKESPASKFRLSATSLANTMLKDWVGEERAREATGRIAVALAASAAAAKDPSDFYACTLQSVGKVIAISALTGIMPSTGSAALAYAIPRRPRKGEAPQLQYQLSHRGVNALANRAGMHMVAIPISYADKLEVEESGDVRVVSRDLDNPPTTESELRGVMVVVRKVDNGKVLCNGWVASKVINARRATSDSFKYAEKPGNEWAKDSSPWHAWYVEQAMKTALHYAISRGWCVVDDTEAVRALKADVESDFDPMTIDAESTAIEHDESSTKTQKLEAKLTAKTNIPTKDGSGLTDEEKAAILKEEAKQS
jgi:recombinational DNA repair protein RecT